MKISRRSVLRFSGMAAALLALTGCSGAGSAALGGGVSGWIKKLVDGNAPAASEAGSVLLVKRLHRPWRRPRRPRQPPRCRFMTLMY